MASRFYTGVDRHFEAMSIEANEWFVQIIKLLYICIRIEFIINRRNAWFVSSFCWNLNIDYTYQYVVPGMIVDCEKGV